MSGSKTIIADENRLDNVHPGDILRHDFLIGGEIDVTEVSNGTGIDQGLLIRLLDAKADIDAALDARLSRYFGMSEGFFLRLQNSYDLEEVHRHEAAALDRIVPRAA